MKYGFKPQLVGSIQMCYHNMAHLNWKHGHLEMKTNEDCDQNEDACLYDLNSKFLELG